MAVGMSTFAGVPAGCSGVPTITTLTGVTSLAVTSCTSWKTGVPVMVPCQTTQWRTCIRVPRILLMGNYRLLILHALSPMKTVLSCVVFGHIWQFCGQKVGILGTLSPKYVRVKGLETGYFPRGQFHTKTSTSLTTQTENIHVSRFKSITQKQAMISLQGMAYFLKLIRLLLGYISLSPMYVPDRLVQMGPLGCLSPFTIKMWIWVYFGLVFSLTVVIQCFPE